ncbi:MAG: PhzF family phenazine biosynthesis protein [Cyclobacteriaceae bacterium]
MEKSLEYTVISVFSSQNLSFKGNPAAVVDLSKPLSGEVMQAIASEINRPATSFIFTDEAGKHHVYWYAPDEEIGLCGHGAAAAGIFLGLKLKKESITLYYPRGEITVFMDKGFKMVLKPILLKKRIEVPQAITDGLGIPILEMWETGNKHFILTDTESSVKNIQPNFDRLRDSDIFGYAVTAPGDKVDFVSRTFVPHVQQLEDHATGSSHAILVPYWAEKLEKRELVSYQLSRRGGLFKSTFENDKLILQGDYLIEKESETVFYRG